jgi:hypothetical protein
MRKGLVMAEIKQYGKSDRQIEPDPPKLSPIEVEDLHTNSDLDTRRESQHHTLGPSQNQAAPGDHNHDGGDSALILTGFTITGSRGGNTSLPSIISALVRLGVKDQSTA